jgi:hypothetical protein
MPGSASDQSSSTLDGVLCPNPSEGTSDTRWRLRHPNSPSDYREFNGFRVPASVEVTWELEKEPFSDARFRLTVLEYNVPRRFSSTRAAVAQMPLPFTRDAFFDVFTA